MSKYDFKKGDVIFLNNGSWIEDTWLLGVFKCSKDFNLIEMIAHFDRDFHPDEYRYFNEYDEAEAIQWLAVEGYAETLRAVSVNIPLLLDRKPFVHDFPVEAESIFWHSQGSI